jgi:hypothetical protein
VTRAAVLVAGMMAAAALGPAVAAQETAETFTATASMTVAGVTRTAPFSVTITRYASAAERDALLAAVREGGSAGARAAVAMMRDAGFIELDGRRTAIKFAGQRPTSSGLVTVVTAESVRLPGNTPAPLTPQTSVDLTVAILDLSDTGALGELASAAKIGVDESGALVIEDHGVANATLTRLTRAR